MRQRIVRRLRRYANYLEGPDARRARARKVPLEIYLFFQRLAKITRFRGIVDVGANTGEFARWCAACFPDVPIHCFEPLPNCREALDALASKIAGLTVYPYALGESDGRISMNRNDFEPSSSVLRMKRRHRELWPKTAHVQGIEVQVRRLDSFASAFDEPLFLKIDVQGYEMQVLRGADAALKKTAAVQLEVLFEELYEGQADFRSVLNYLADRGFRFVEFPNERRMGPAKELTYADAVFVAEHYMA